MSDTTGAETLQALQELSETLREETPLLRASLSIWYWDLRRKVAEHIREER